MKKAIVLWSVVLFSLALVAGEREGKRYRVLVDDAVKSLRYQGVVEGVGMDGDEPWVVVKPAPLTPVGTCDTLRECKERLDAVCREAGHGSAANADISEMPEGGKRCSGMCADGSGAQAFVECPATVNPRGHIAKTLLELQECCGVDFGGCDNRPSGCAGCGGCYLEPWGVCVLCPQVNPE